MAAILIVSGFAIKQKIDQRKQRKRDKKAYDEMRFKDLQKDARKRTSAPGSRVAEADSPEEERMARFLDETFPWDQKTERQRSRSQSSTRTDEEAGRIAGDERDGRKTGGLVDGGMRAENDSRRRLIEIDS